MAARSKTAMAIGSSQWIQNERDQAQQFHELEVEEFSYAARNELDWLNEHMAEVFSRDQRYVMIANEQREMIFWSALLINSIAISPTCSRLQVKGVERRL